MSGINTSVQIQDRVSGALNRITAALYTTTSAFQGVDRASDTTFNTSAVQAMAQELGAYEERIQQIESELVDANNKLEQMEEQTKKAAQAGDTLKNVFRGVIAIVSAIGIGKIVETSDELIQTTARLNNMNDGLQTTDELMNMVYSSAQDARGSFADMADVVARFGNNAKDAFGSSAEVVSFANLVQKQMTIAGASTAEASNAMLQLSQGLGSGALRGDELNSIFEQAPNLIQNIADYLDVPIGTIREMASEGQLTSDIVKNAIFAASDEINSKFEEMPMTWGQVWQSIQNKALMAFRPILNKINELVNSEKFQQFVNNITGALSELAKVATKIFDLVVSIANAIADSWSFISPIIYGVVAALMTYGAYLAITKGIEIASAVAKGLMAAATWATTSATWAATTAQYGLNGAMYACPIVWIIGLIVALIAILAKVCSWIANVTGAARSGIGIIAGSLAAAFAFIGNLFITLWNMVVEIVAVMHNLFATFANFLGNLFTKPVAAVIGLVVGMGDAILGIVEGALEALSWITFGLVDFSDDISRIRKDMNGWYEDTFEYTTFVEKVDADDLKKDVIGYDDAFGAGAAFGDGIADKFSFDTSEIDSAYTTTDAGSVADSLASISDDTSDIKDSVDVSDENLKYLRDIAERDVVNRFTTAEIKVDMQNTNNISNGMDIDGVVEQLTMGVQEAMERAAEGVH